MKYTRVGGWALGTKFGLVAAGAFGTACSFTPLATTDVHYGAAVGLGAHNCIAYDTITGKCREARVRINENSIGNLREDLLDFFGERDHFAIRLDSRLGELGCSPGKPCFVIHSPQNFSILPFDSANNINIDSNFINNPLGLLNTTLGARFDLPTSAKTTLAKFNISDNFEIRGRLRPETLEIGLVGTLPPSSLPALKMKLTATPSEPLRAEWRCSNSQTGHGLATNAECDNLIGEVHSKVANIPTCLDHAYLLPIFPTECAQLEIAKELALDAIDSCEINANIWVKSLTYDVGFQPKISQSCKPSAQRKDVLGYAESFLQADAAQFNQGCLDVTPNIAWANTLNIQVGDFSSNGDINVGVNVCPAFAAARQVWNAAATANPV